MTTYIPGRTLIRKDRALSDGVRRRGGGVAVLVDNRKPSVDTRGIQSFTKDWQTHLAEETVEVSCPSIAVNTLNLIEVPVHE